MGAKQWLAVILAGYLGLYQGYLALWNSERSAPYHIFPYAAETYSHADRTALELGIPFHSQQELTRLLEDYFS